VLCQGTLFCPRAGQPRRRLWWRFPRERREISTTGVPGPPARGFGGHRSLVDAHTVASVNAEPDCIFCGIVAGAISSTTIARSERAIAFMDINPVTHGHALVVPRVHATDLLDITAEDLAACVHLAQEVAGRAKDRLGADGVKD
jgi:hypothetical protein